MKINIVKNNKVYIHAFFASGMDSDGYESVQGTYAAEENGTAWIVSEERLSMDELSSLFPDKEIIMGIFPDKIIEKFSSICSHRIYVPAYGGTDSKLVLPFSWRQRVFIALMHGLTLDKAKKFASAKVRWKHEFLLYFGDVSKMNGMNVDQIAKTIEWDCISKQNIIKSEFCQILWNENIFEGRKHEDFYFKKSIQKECIIKWVIEGNSEKTAIHILANEFELSYPRAKSLYKLSKIMIGIQND